MRAQGHRLRVFRVEPFYDLRPEHACGAHFGNFHEKVFSLRPEEREAGCEGVDVETCRDAGAEVFQSIGKRVGHFEVSRRAGLLHVIAGDRDRVEFRHLLRGEFKNVRDDAHRGFRRIDVGIAHHEFLQDVVLNGARELVERGSLFEGGDDIECQDREDCAVHRHRDADPVERDAAEEDLHVED